MAAWSMRQVAVISEKTKDPFAKPLRLIRVNGIKLRSFPMIAMIAAGRSPFLSIQRIHRIESMDKKVLPACWGELRRTHEAICREASFEREMRARRGARGARACCTPVTRTLHPSR